MRTALSAIAVLAMSCTLVTGVRTTSASADEAPWGSPEHRFRLPVVVASGEVAPEAVVVATVDFTAALHEAGAEPGAAFDPATLAVQEVSGPGEVVDPSVAFQFDPASDFSAATAATGELLLLITAPGTPSGARRFLVYFDTLGSGAPTAAVTSRVLVDDGHVDEGQESVRIATPSGEWYYQKAGGALSSLVDAGGNDWIGYHPTGGAAGSYRGIPNLVYPQGHLHPGATSATTSIDHAGPLRATLTSTTADGLWSIRWDFYPTHSTATVLAAGAPYWFLYEGTPGGLLEPATDVFMLPDGTVQPLTKKILADLPGEEWVAFGDPAVGRSLLVLNHVQDDEPELLRTQSQQMTVFGFGRSVVTPSLTGTGRSFTVALIDSLDHGDVGQLAERAQAGSDVTIGTGEAEGSDVSPPLITDLAIEPGGPDALQIAWLTDETANATVRWGPTADVDAGALSDPTMATEHQLTVAGLACETAFYLQAESTDLFGNVASSEAVVATTGPCGPPVDPEDPVDGSAVPVDVVVSGDGVVERSPDLA
ncbi:MAG: hypothetical protein GEV08_13075, partial [Acidimicrobiia bacterium]|nr:hypothetical protein [Acidimicrobiia bacterium]